MGELACLLRASRALISSLKPKWKVEGRKLRPERSVGHGKLKLKRPTIPCGGDITWSFRLMDGSVWHSHLGTIFIYLSFPAAWQTSNHFQFITHTPKKQGENEKQSTELIIQSCPWLRIYGFTRDRYRWEWHGHNLFSQEGAYSPEAGKIAARDYEQVLQHIFTG